MISKNVDREPQVLIIDDEPEICELISGILDKRHIHSTAVHRTNDLASLIQENEFDVIISDVDLPGMSGLDILNYVRNTCPTTKMILMTAHHVSEWIQQALRGGAYDYLVKPFDLEQFYASVSGALQERRIQSHSIDPKQLFDRYLHLVLDDAYCVQCLSGASLRLAAMNPTNVYGKPVDSVFVCHPDSSDSDLPADASLNFAKLLSTATSAQTVSLSLSIGSEPSFPAEVSVHPIALNQPKPCYYLQIVDLSPFDGSSISSVPLTGMANCGLKQDPLTGLANHIAFQEELRTSRYHCQRYGRCMSVILIGIKDFQAINSTHGYAEGDRLIIELSNRLRKQVRLSDFLCRYSVNEFGLILPETEGSGALIAANRICNRMEEEPITVGAETIPVTLVAGIVQCNSGFIESQAELLRRATQALDYAKNDEQQQVILWGSSLGVGKAFDGTHPDPVGKSLASNRNAARVLRAAFLEMIRSLVAAVEAKDPYTKNHSFNVADYVEQLARKMGCNEQEIEILRCAAILHDVGKIGIPDAILTKPGRLTDEEFEIIKTHSTIGADILVQSSFLSAEVQIVRHHHERWDGKGYPDGLAGEIIPLGARLINICDSVDCMFNIRTYKHGYNMDRVMSELERNSGTQFDPNLAKLAIEFFTSNPDKIHYTDVKEI